MHIPATAPNINFLSTLATLTHAEYGLPELSVKTKVRNQDVIFQDEFSRRKGMKRLLVLILVLTLLVVTGTLVSADAKTRLTKSNDNIENSLNSTEAY